MPSRDKARRRSDGGEKSGGGGRVKALGRTCGGALAPALTRPPAPDHTQSARSRLTANTVAEERAQRASKGALG